jgi:hypothetical protein
MRSRTRSAFVFTILVSLCAALPATAAPRDDDAPHVLIQSIVRVARFLHHLVTAPFDDSGTISVPKP